MTNKKLLALSSAILLLPTLSFATAHFCVKNTVSNAKNQVGMFGILIKNDSTLSGTCASLVNKQFIGDYTAWTKRLAFPKNTSSLQLCAADNKSIGSQGWFIYNQNFTVQAGDTIKLVTASSPNGKPDPYGFQIEITHHTCL